MATEGDKIAAATLTAKLIDLLPGVADAAAKFAKTIELYGDVLREVALINPDTGRGYTADEIRRMRQPPTHATK